MSEFLSCDSIKLHMAYVNNLRLKLSILEKSVGVKLDGFESTRNMRLEPDVREEVTNLLWLIKSHEIFFASFTSECPKIDLTNTPFGSREGLLYELLRLGLSRCDGFIFLSVDRCGRILIYLTEKLDKSYIANPPRLCIDLSEHAYFLDYRFEKEKFLKNALNKLDLRRLKSELT